MFVCPLPSSFFLVRCLLPPPSFGGGAVVIAVRGEQLVVQLQATLPVLVLVLGAGADTHNRKSRLVGSVGGWVDGSDSFVVFPCVDVAGLRGPDLSRSLRSECIGVVKDRRSTDWLGFKGYPPNRSSFIRVVCFRFLFVLAVCVFFL